MTTILISIYVFVAIVDLILLAAVFSKKILTVPDNFWFIGSMSLVPVLNIYAFFFLLKVMKWNL